MIKDKKLVAKIEQIEECKRILNAFNVKVSKGNTGEPNIEAFIAIISRLFSSGYDLDSISLALDVTLAEVLFYMGTIRPDATTREDFFGILSACEDSENPDLDEILYESTLGDKGYIDYYTYEDKETREIYIISEVFNYKIDVDGHEIVDLNMILYCKVSDRRRFVLYDEEKITEDGVANLYPALEPIVNGIFELTEIYIPWRKEGR